MSTLATALPREAAPARPRPVFRAGAPALPPPRFVPGDAVVVRLPGGPERGVVRTRHSGTEVGSESTRGGGYVWEVTDPKRPRAPRDGAGMYMVRLDERDVFAFEWELDAA